MVKKTESTLLKKPWIRWGLLLAGGLGLLLIALSEWLPSSAAVTPDPAVCAAELETRLEELLGQMEGVGACRVMVTLENGEEYVYAEAGKDNTSYAEESGDTSRKNSSESHDSDPVVVGGSGLLVTAVQPTVRGVAVICEGGGQEAVCRAVTEAVATVLNISTRRVCVISSS